MECPGQQIDDHQATTFANFVGKVVTFYHAFVSLPSPLFDFNGLFFCSIVWQTFNIETGGGGTSE